MAHRHRPHPMWRLLAEMHRPRPLPPGPYLHRLEFSPFFWPNTGQFSPTDIQSLIAALGGNANVVSFRDVRGGLTLTGGNQVVSWADIRGSVGFGPTSVCLSPSAHLVLSGGAVAGDGDPSAYLVATNAVYDLFAQSLTVYYVGTLLNPALSANGPSNLGSAAFGGGRASIVFLNNSGFVSAQVSPALNDCAPPGNHGYRTLDGRIRSMAMWFNQTGASAGATSVPSVIGTATAGSVSVDNPTNGEAIGAHIDGALPMAFSCLAEIVVKGTPTNAQLNAVSQWAIAVHGAKDNSPDFVTWDGDSICNGAILNTTVGYTFNYATVALQTVGLFPTYSDVNIGVPGLKVTDLIARYNTDNRYTEVSGAGIYADPTRIRDIVASNAGTNDLNAGSTAASTFASMQTYAQLVHAQGRKVIQGTILPRGDNPGMETARAALNALIVANVGHGATQFDAVANVASDPVMGVFANTSNPTYYFSDLVHPTATGHGLLAPYWATAVVSA